MKRFLSLAACALLLGACQDQGGPEGLLTPGGAQLSTTLGVVIDPALEAALSTAAEDDQLEVILSFNPSLTTAETIESSVQELGAGVLGFRNLPMVATLATPAQVTAMQSLVGVRSLYLNGAEQALNKEGVGSIQADQVHALGITGKGVGVAILDTGIDGTHPDLDFGTKTVQNAKTVAHSKDVYTFPGRDSVTGLKTPKPAKKGADLVVENVENTDNDHGHGSHVAGTAAGNGAASDGKYGGVAPGASLIGVSASVGGVFPTLNLLMGFDYIIEKREDYNIQVVNNSWGSAGKFNPENPIAIATKEVHDAGITVVFAAGNDGPAQNTMNRHSVAPWVIGVAAGCKLGDDPTNSRSHCVDPQGRASVLADFSSRGIPGDALYHPDVLAPGVHVVSARNLTGGTVVSGSALTHDALTCAIATEHKPYYTCISGTSMASPHVAGVVALMEEASGGALTPDQALSVLTGTARAVDGFAEWEIGAGYVDALAAVKAVQR